MCFLKLNDIDKTFPNGVKALSRINLSVNEGSFLTLIGPSGCGKTTLLRIIAGLEQPDSGEIIMQGNNITAYPPKDRNVSMVFQNYTLFPHLNVFNNIAFPLKVIKKEKTFIKDKVQEVSLLLNISHLLFRKPKELSGGEKQRVAIARAILREPSVFLFDEPFSNLDADLRAVMRLELRRIQKKLGITTIYVTHDQKEAITFGDRLAVMKEGTIIQEGKPEEINKLSDSALMSNITGKSNYFKGCLSVKDGITSFFPVSQDKNCQPLFSTRNNKLLKKAEKSNNMHLTLSIRPDDIYLDNSSTDNSLPINAVCFLVESFGNETVALFTLCPGNSSVPENSSEVLTVLLKGDCPIKSGDNTTLYLDIDKIQTDYIEPFQS